MAELFVDLGALTELARQLSAVRDALQRADEISVEGRCFGSERLQSALDDVVGGWRDGRRQIAVEGLGEPVTVKAPHR